MCQSGCTFGSAMSMSPPSDDWCIVGSRIAAAMKYGITLWSRGPHATPILRPARRGAPGGAVEDGREHLDPEDEDVRHDAGGDLEERRREVPPRRHRQHERVPVAPERDHDRRAAERVADRAEEDRGPDEPVVLAAVEEVREQPDAERARADARERHHVHRLPDAPREPVAHVGHRADARDEAVRHHRGREREQGHQHEQGPPDDPPPDRHGLRLGAHGCPPFSFSCARAARSAARCSRRTFRRMTNDIAP